jgi:probable HAF family extracellular repeat protein
MKSILVRACLGLLIVLAMPTRLVHAQGPKTARYTVTDIGTLGGANSFAYSNNNPGMVAGGANIPGQNDVIKQTAFIWYGGQPISLGTLGGSACPDCSSEGSAVSANGTAALLSETASMDPNGQEYCEFGTHRQCLAAFWKNGTLTALPTLPGGNNSAAFFENKFGEAVGASEIGTPDVTCATPSQVRRFVAAKWSPSGQVTPLPPLPGDTVSFAFANNDVGQAVGMSGLCSEVILPPFVPGSPLAPHAVLWDADGMPHEIGPPAGSAGVLNIANAINNPAEIVMNSAMTDDTVHTFLWSNGVLHDLGTYPEGSLVTVVPCCNDINDHGQIVGFSIDPSFNMRALLWESADAAPVDLNSLIPAESPWYLLTPGGINDAGEIAVTAVNLNTFELHAVVASPIAGIAPAARGATKPPALPENVRKLLKDRLRH